MPRLMLIPALLLLAAPAGAAPTALTAKQVATVEAAKPNRPVAIAPPRNLFHWSSQAGAAHIAAGMARDKRFPMKSTKRSYLAMLHPELNERPALFAWSHPATGLAFGSNEIYGGAEALTWLKIRPNAKAVVLISNDAGGNEPVAVPDDVDLILHATKFTRDDGKVVPSLMEWVVLKPSAIEGATSDPARIAGKLRPWVSRIKRPGFAFDLWDRHSYGGFFDRENLRRSVLPLLERYLERAKAAPSADARAADPTASRRP